VQLNDSLEEKEMNELLSKIIPLLEYNKIYNRVTTYTCIAWRGAPIVNSHYKYASMLIDAIFIN